MDINTAKRTMLLTHIAALGTNQRPNAVELISGPGIGKSDSIKQTAAQMAVELNEPVGLVVFMLATISSVDVRGFMMPVRRPDNSGMDTYFSTPPWFPTKLNTTVFTPDGVVHAPGTWTDPVPRVGILFLDEWGQAEAEVQKPAAELLLHGIVGTAELPVGWRVVAASNRMSDRSGVMRPLMFTVNRRLELKIDALLPAWLEWANSQVPSQRPHYLTLSFAQKNPGLVFRSEVPTGTDPFCTPRTLCLMDKDLMALRSEEDIKRNRVPMDQVAREVAAGWIGAGEAAQYFTHAKFAFELPDIEDIEREPATAKLPANLDAQMVTGYMLAHVITERNARKVMAYLGRMKVEMQVLTVKAIAAQESRAPLILNTLEFTAWLSKHKDLMIASRS